jgi:hypothetical protein
LKKLQDKEEPIEETKVSTPVETVEMVNKFNEIVDSFISTDKPSSESIINEQVELDQDKFNQIVDTFIGTSKSIDDVTELVTTQDKEEPIEETKVSTPVETVEMVNKFNEIVDSFISTDKPSSESIINEQVELDQDKFNQIVDTFIGTSKSIDDVTELVTTQDKEEPIEETKVSTPVETVEMVNKFNEIVDSFISTDKPSSESIINEQVELDQDKFNQIVDTFIGTSKSIDDVTELVTTQDKEEPIEETKVSTPVETVEMVNKFNEIVDSFISTDKPSSESIINEQVELDQDKFNQIVDTFIGTSKSIDDVTELVTTQDKEEPIEETKVSTPVETVEMVNKFNEIVDSFISTDKPSSESIINEQVELDQDKFNQIVDTFIGTSKSIDDVTELVTTQDKEEPIEETKVSTPVETVEMVNKFNEIVDSFISTDKPSSESIINEQVELDQDKFNQIVDTFIGTSKSIDDVTELVTTQDKEEPIEETKVSTPVETVEMVNKFNEIVDSFISTDKPSSESIINEQVELDQDKFNQIVDTFIGTSKSIDDVTELVTTQDKEEPIEETKVSTPVETVEMVNKFNEIVDSFISTDKPSSESIINEQVELDQDKFNQIVDTFIGTSKSIDDVTELVTTQDKEEPIEETKVSTPVETVEMVNKFNEIVDSFISTDKPSSESIINEQVELDQDKFNQIVDTFIGTSKSIDDVTELVTTQDKEEPIEETKVSTPVETVEMVNKFNEIVDSFISTDKPSSESIINEQVELDQDKFNQIVDTFIGTSKSIDDVTELVTTQDKEEPIEETKVSTPVETVEMVNKFNEIVDSFISTDKPSSESIINEQVELDQDKFNQIVDTFIGTSKSIDDVTELVTTQDKEEPIEETKVSTPVETVEMVNKFNEIVDSFISTDKPSSESIINEQVELDQDKFNQIVDTFIGTSKSIDDVTELVTTQDKEEPIEETKVSTPVETVEMVNKFNEIVDSFISTDKPSSESIINEQVELDQDKFNQIVDTFIGTSKSIDDVTELVTTQDKEEPIEETKVSTPVETVEMVNKFNEIVDSFISTDKPSSESIINEQVELDQDKFNQIVDTFIGTSKSIDDVTELVTTQVTTQDKEEPIEETKVSTPVETVTTQDKEIVNKFNEI